MPCINKPCFNCGKSDKEVYERYQVTSGTTIELKAEKIGEKFFRIVPKNMEYWCTDCYRVENAKMEIIDETVDEAMKQTLAIIKKSLKNQKRHCVYPACVVQYFEHWHITEHTLTFLKPGAKDENI